MPSVRLIGEFVAAALVPVAVEALPPGPHCPPPAWDQEPNDSMAQASPIGLAPLGGLAVAAKGTIDPPGDVDFFRVPMLAGERLWILADTALPAIGTRDSFVRVRSESGTVLAVDDDDGTAFSHETSSVVSLDAAAIAGFAVPATGNYYIEVTAAEAGQRMAYRLMIAVTPNVSVPEDEPANDRFPTPDSSGGVLGQIGPGDVDLYAAHVLDNGLRLVIADGAVDALPVDLVLTFEPFLPGLVVDSSQPPSPGAEAVTLPESGSIVHVTGSTLSGGAGRYRLGVFYTGDTCLVPVGLQSFAVE